MWNGSEEKVHRKFQVTRSDLDSGGFSSEKVILCYENTKIIL